jgi:hypothetical protein
MTRNGYLIAGLAAAGAMWAARRWGLADRLTSAMHDCGTDSSPADSSRRRAETIFRNTPTATDADLSHLGATGI